MFNKDINYIKQNYPIVEIAKRLGLEVKKDNKTICPFHNDKNPSLSFNTQKNYYHCFSCGASGDNIKLVMKILNYDFKSAIEFICGKEYNPVYKNTIKIIEETNNSDYSKIYKTFIELLDNDEAIKYLESRRITKKQVIEHSIKNLSKDIKKQYFIIKELLKIYNENDLLKSGIISKNKQSNSLYLFHYKHRLIIPYFDIDNNTILSIQGRNIDNDTKPKYLFNKNSKDSIYNIHKLSNIKDIIISEGVIDALSLERLGYTSIALSGSTKTNLLYKYNILENYNIYSCSDNDNAGNKLIKDIYKLDNYKGAFLIKLFSNTKDINELLNKVEIKYFSIDNIKYSYFEIPNDKICILDYYIFTKNELKYIKQSNNFNKALKELTADKKILTEKEYKYKYGELN